MLKEQVERKRRELETFHAQNPHTNVGTEVLSQTHLGESHLQPPLTGAEN